MSLDRAITILINFSSSVWRVSERERERKRWHEVVEHEEDEKKKFFMNGIAQEDFFFFYFIFISSRISFHEWMEGKNKLLSFDDGYSEILNFVWNWIT